MVKIVWKGSIYILLRMRNISPIFFYLSFLMDGFHNLGWIVKKMEGLNTDPFSQTGLWKTPVWVSISRRKRIKSEGKISIHFKSRGSFVPKGRKTWRIFGSVLIDIELRGIFTPGKIRCHRNTSLLEKRPGGETGGENWGIFTPFLIVVHRFYILQRASDILHHASCSW